MSASDSQSTALSRSLASLPSDYRARLEASNLPIEIAVAIADAVDVATSERSPAPRGKVGDPTNAELAEWIEQFVADGYVEDFGIVPFLRRFMALRSETATSREAVLEEIAGRTKMRSFANGEFSWCITDREIRALK